MKIKLQEKGCGDMATVVQKFNDAQVQYAFVRREITDDGGDSKRIKFVFLTWYENNHHNGTRSTHGTAPP